MINSEVESETDDRDWHNGDGEAPDKNAMLALSLTHKALAKFPELRKRYQKYIGTAAVVSSVVVALASIAVERRLHRGESPESILASITPDEIENVAKEKRVKPSFASIKSRFRH